MPPAKPGGFPRAAGFRIGWCFCESPHCESLSHGFAVPAPFGKGAFWRPVSFHCAIPGFFKLSIDSVGMKHPKNTQPKTGAEAKTHHPSQSEGSISRWFHPGDSQGGNNSSGSELFPLKPASLHTFLPEQESMAPLASACRKPIEEQTKRL